MNSNLQIFKNEQFGQVRTLAIENKPYFVGKDIAEILGYNEPHKAIARHCKGGIKHPILTEGGQQQMSIIPEGDLYRLIIKSKLPKAQEFEEWVMDEVLPQIRQTGGYIPTKEEDSEEDIMAKALVIAQKTLERKNARIKELEPKAKGFQQFMDTNNTYSWDIVAKNLGIGRNTMLSILRENKIIQTDEYFDNSGRKHRGERHNVPYQVYMKYFDVKFLIKGDKRYAKVLVKAEGQEYLRRKLVKLGYIKEAA